VAKTPLVEATMVGTVLVVVSALIIALIGCAMVKPISDGRPKRELAWYD
jgi:hypothetical protein